MIAFRVEDLKPRMSRTGHVFLTQTHDDGREHRSHGYPDECYSLTTFTDSLVALAYEGVWIMQPPIVDLRNAIVVDFISKTESHAESSLLHKWNGPWELPMGAVNTVYGRRETNEQNALIERHMLFLGTSMTMGDFHRRVIERLIDVHSCADPNCAICATRFPRGLAESFQILADGTEQAAIHLFSNWAPSAELAAKLAADKIEIRHHALSTIPRPDLKANRSYSIWDGSPAQADEFLLTVWAPSWRAKSPTLRPLAVASKASGTKPTPAGGTKSAQSPKEDLVYGYALLSLVFMTRTRAEDLAKVHPAIAASKTWGEFRRLVPGRIVTELEGITQEHPADSDRLNVWGYDDGDWPATSQAQLEWMPDDVVELGSIVETILNGDSLEFSESNEREIVRRLEAHGWKVHRDDALVRLAMDDR
jgi:hypothetical protein